MLPKFCPLVGTPEFEQAVANLKLRSVAEKYTIDRGNLLLLGPSGAGKTTTAQAIVRRLACEILAANSGLGCLSTFVWTTGSALAHAYRNWPLGSEPKVIVDAKCSSFLVIDEVGFELIADNVLYQVIDHRYSKCIPTIVTTGLEREAFIARYGVALDRRLTDVGVGMPLEIPPQKKGQLNLVRS
jgi:DNA replication protein DnaC